MSNIIHTPLGETLEKVLKQGLKEEHMQYKDGIVNFLMNMRDRIKVEDLTFYTSS
jgi:hypothetical protein